MTGNSANVRHPSRWVTEMPAYAVAPSPETLLRAVADAAGRAVSAQGAAAVLHAPDAEVSTAVTGTAGADADAHEVPVRHGREQLGSIRVWLGSGARVHTSDQRLLEALADQTAVVFRNVGLQASLTQRPPRATRRQWTRGVGLT